MIAALVAAVLLPLVQKQQTGNGWAASRSQNNVRRSVIIDKEPPAVAKSYYSIVLDQPADKVWAVIRPFDHYAWAGVESETIIEAGKAGDQVGAVRRVAAGDKIIRQILLAHSDLDRSYTYALCDPAPFPVRNYIATIRVAPIIESNKAFVEWWATFDCAADEYDRWTGYFEKEGFAKWLAALRRFLQADARVI